jgi:hypothetical protein
VWPFCFLNDGPTDLNPILYFWGLFDEETLNITLNQGEINMGKSKSRVKRFNELYGEGWKYNFHRCRWDHPDGRYITKRAGSYLGDDLFGEATWWMNNPNTVGRTQIFPFHDMYDFLSKEK